MQIENSCFNFSHKSFVELSKNATIVVYYYINTLYH